MSILNGNFTKNKKPVNSGQYIYDTNFNSDLNVEYNTSEYFPNWSFNKINNSKTNIIIANGNNAFGTALPPSNGGSNQCLVVQQSYDKMKDDPTKPPILKMKNTISFGPGKYLLSFYAKYRGDTNQSLSVSISNSSSDALVNTPVTDVKNSWTKKTYNFTIETGTSYDLMLTVTNAGLSSDVSIFLTDFEISFVDFLPVLASQINATTSTTNPLQFSAAPTTPAVALSQTKSPSSNELRSLIHSSAAAIKQMEKFTLYSEEGIQKNPTLSLPLGPRSLFSEGFGFDQTTRQLTNPISDYYNFRPKLN
jgi:hypothetical protein